MTKTKKSKKSNKKGKDISSSLAREKDGTIQITFSIPYKIVEAEKKKTAKELGSDMEVPGFRKGKAPLDKIIEQIPENTLLEQTLNNIIPQMFANAIKENNLKPAMYPKFDLIKAKEGEDWQIRATTAELPEVKLGDYKKKVSGALKAQNIWTPDKAKDDDKQEPTREEKEQAALNALLESVEIKVPKSIVEEEVNSRVARLIERIEKMGLSLDSYLASIGKTAETLRKEYAEQSEKAIAYDLALTKIAEEENLEPDKEQFENVLKNSQADLNQEQKGEQKRVVETALKKRAALDYLVSLL